MQLILIHEVTGELKHLDFAGNGVAFVDNQPSYFDTNQDAKEFILFKAVNLIEDGYRVYTGDGVTRNAAENPQP